MAWLSALECVDSPVDEWLADVAAVVDVDVLSPVDVAAASDQQPVVPAWLDVFWPFQLLFLQQAWCI
jgi:hypothetical protein